MDNKELFEFRNVSFYYDKNKALDNISLSIKPGKFYGIVGPNGCGKTTLLDLLVRNKTPESGTIKYHGQEINKYSRKNLAKNIALVPQDFYINFSFSVGETVLMGRHPYIPRFASPSSEDLKIVDKIMDDLKITSFKDKNITDLSGGEKQRVIFARALAQNTPVLILDEGTSNMDIQYTLNIMDIVANGVEAKKRTVIAVMHDLNLASVYCDRLVFMKSGRVVSEGNIDKVLSKRNIKDVFGIDCNISYDKYSESKHVIFRRRKLENG